MTSPLQCPLVIGSLHQIRIPCDKQAEQDLGMVIDNMEKGGKDGKEHIETTYKGYDQQTCWSQDIIHL